MFYVLQFNENPLKNDEEMLFMYLKKVIFILKIFKFLY